MPGIATGKEDKTMAHFDFFLDDEDLQVDAMQTRLDVSPDEDDGPDDIRQLILCVTPEDDDPPEEEESEGR